MDYKYEVVKLHRFPHLIEETAHLLSSEWPRSIDARCNNLQKSSDDLPCSLVLLQNSCDDGNEMSHVVGYTRLCKVLGQEKSAMIESVVVDKKLRGHGFGRTIMEASENFAKTLGFEKLHLSTSDKCKFYEHLGYSLSYPVSPETEVSQFLRNKIHSFYMNILKEYQELVSPPPTHSLEPTLGSGPLQAPPLTALPPVPPTLPQPPPAPPPPPPPPLLKTINHQRDTCLELPNSKKIMWMEKLII